MPVSPTPSVKPGAPKKRETFKSALVQIAVAGLVLTGLVLAYYRSRDTKKHVGEVLLAARAAALRGNPADARKALNLLDDALARDAKAPDALALAAALNTDLWLLHHEPGAEERAKEFLERARRAGSKSDDRYGTEALHLLAAGDPRTAEAFVEEQRKKGASTAKLSYALALAMKAQGNLALARQAFASAMDKAWKDPQYSAAWGEALLEEGVPGAADAFNKGLGNNPDFIRGRLGLALARVQRKDRVGESETMVKQVLTREGELSAPLKARAVAIQAAIANIQAQPDQAITLANEAIALNPDDPWALFAKANGLALKNDASAPAAYDAVVARKKSSPVFYFEGAQRLQKAGQAAAAIALLDRYEKVFQAVVSTSADGKPVAWLDRDDRYWLARGDVLMAMERPDEAMASFDKAIAAKSYALPRAYYAKSALLLRQKDYTKAQELLQDITPQDGTGQIPEAYAALGDLLFHKKEWGPGCQNFAFALTRMKAQQAPRESLNELLRSVESKLKSSGQGPIAKLWIEEAKPLIQ
jgi:tetratricopeptide (TPR) repeat protein